MKNKTFNENFLTAKKACSKNVQQLVLVSVKDTI